ncbi:uncharacterized protein LOC133188860 [Saccostrea echinata]|uniref:uncharacterized protein LOC133188860 n=1 Tax=Saccostrea echinata TaxID=191078 RepID=UPI002A838D2B|nr:uncharacterized protein LOC133188860 [Saccostrea echinata]
MNLHLIGCFAVIAWTATNVLAVNTAQVKGGLTLAKSLTDYIETQDFSKTVTKIASFASTYLGILGPALGFVLSFFSSGPSAELLAIQKLYKEVTLRFDHVDHQFADLKRQISWSSVEVQYGQYESKIHAVGQKYKDLVASSSRTDFEARKSLFLDNYRQDFSNSAEKLYNGVVNEHQTFRTALFESAINNFEWDRKKTQNFMLGVTKLLVFGATLEMAYYHLKFPSQESYYRQQWQVKFEHFKNKLSDIDHKLQTQFGSQLATDVDKYVVNHAHSSNSDITNHLYDVIARKYYFLNWMVAVSDHSSDPDQYAVHTCGGTHGLQNNNHGKNVVVASVPKNKAHLTTSQQHITHIATYETRHRHGGRRATGVYTVHIPANEAYNHFPSTARGNCNTYGSVGIISRKLNPGFRSPSAHLYIRDDGHYFKVYAFG